MIYDLTVGCLLAPLGLFLFLYIPIIGWYIQCIYTSVTVVITSNLQIFTILSAAFRYINIPTAVSNYQVRYIGFFLLGRATKLAFGFQSSLPTYQRSSYKTPSLTHFITFTFTFTFILSFSFSISIDHL